MSQLGGDPDKYYKPRTLDKLIDGIIDMLMNPWVPTIIFLLLMAWVTAALYAAATAGTAATPAPSAPCGCP
jgi:hypothetical protein